VGEQRVLVFERLISLLYKLERFSEAERYLTDLHKRSVRLRPVNA